MPHTGGSYSTAVPVVRTMRQLYVLIMGWVELYSTPHRKGFVVKSHTHVLWTLSSNLNLVMGQLYRYAY
eukprot:SAG31_NODE_40359_length_281_cov_0.851648_1_plen_68_part_10